MSEDPNPKNQLMRLSASHLAMLFRLDDGHDEEDSVGVELGKLTVLDVAIAETLVGRGLATKSIGWRSSCWYRPSPTGWTVIRLLKPLR
jgi:hypothetical protein